MTGKKEWREIQIEEIGNDRTLLMTSVNAVFSVFAVFL